MMRNAALAFLFVASAVVLATSWSASVPAQWVFALATVAFPPALVWIAVARRRPGRTLVVALAALLLLLESATVGVLAWRDPARLDRWLMGLPPAGLALLLGLWLLPFSLTTWAHIATFDPVGLRPDDLDALRRRRRPPDA